VPAPPLSHKTVNDPVEYEPAIKEPLVLCFRALLGVKNHLESTQTSFRNDCRLVYIFFLIAFIKKHILGYRAIISFGKNLATQEFIHSK